MTKQKLENQGNDSEELKGEIDYYFEKTDDACFGWEFICSIHGKLKDGVDYYCEHSRIYNKDESNGDFDYDKKKKASKCSLPHKCQCELGGYKTPEISMIGGSGGGTGNFQQDKKGQWIGEGGLNYEFNLILGKKNEKNEYPIMLNIFSYNDKGGIDNAGFLCYATTTQDIVFDKVKSRVSEKYLLENKLLLSKAKLEEMRRANEKQVDELNSKFKIN